MLKCSMKRADRPLGNSGSREKCKRKHVSPWILQSPVDPYSTELQYTDCPDLYCITVRLSHGKGEQVSGRFFTRYLMYVRRWADR